MFCTHDDNMCTAIVKSIPIVRRRIKCTDKPPQCAANHGSSNAGVGIGNLSSCGIPHSPPDPELL